MMAREIHDSRPVEIARIAFLEGSKSFNYEYDGQTYRIRATVNADNVHLEDAWPRAWVGNESRIVNAAVYAVVEGKDIPSITSSSPNDAHGKGNTATTTPTKITPTSTVSLSTALLVAIWVFSPKRDKTDLFILDGYT